MRYICTDFHGMYGLWTQIHNFIGKDDILYCLGDSTDRGPNGIMILKEMMADDRIVYIMGNHDEFIVKALSEYFKEQDTGEYISTYDSVHSLWECNGGNPTWIELTCDCTDEQKKEIYQYLCKAPIRVDVGCGDRRFVLTHSGFDPNSPFLKRDDYKSIKNEYIWNREHFDITWVNEVNGNDWSKTYMLHGHTPIQYLNHVNGRTWFSPYRSPDTDVPVKPEILRYADGHKIDLDLCSVASGAAALYCLETDEVKYFFVDIDKEENL